MRRENRSNTPQISGVSIHASVKDATLPISRVVVPRLVSIHASVKDATRKDVDGFHPIKFQSTHL